MDYNVHGLVVAQRVCSDNSMQIVTKRDSR